MHPLDSPIMHRRDQSNQTLIKLVYAFVSGHSVHNNANPVDLVCSQ